VTPNGTFYGTARTPGQVLARKTACDELAAVLMALAEVEGVSVVGPGGLLAGLTKTVLETALGAEMAWIASDDLDRLGPDGGCQVRFGDCDRSLHPGKRAAAVGGGGVAGRQPSAEGGAQTLGGERASTRSPKPTSGGFYDRHLPQRLPGLRAVSSGRFRAAGAVWLRRLR